MTALLGLVPWYVRILAVIFLAAALVSFGWVKGANHQEASDAANDAKRVQLELKAQIAATNHTLAEEHRKQDATQEIANEVRKQAEAYQATATGNRAAGDRLRDQLAAASHCPSAAQPSTAAGSAPADPAASVLADVQRRLEDAENATAEFADASRRAGIACERSYETVAPKE